MKNLLGVLLLVSSLLQAGCTTTRQPIEPIVSVIDTIEGREHVVSARIAQDGKFNAVKQINRVTPFGPCLRAGWLHQTFNYSHASQRGTVEEGEIGWSLRCSQSQKVDFCVIATHLKNRAVISTLTMGLFHQLHGL